MSEFEPTRDGAGPGAVNAGTAIAAASYIVGITQLIINLQPIILGALAEHYGLSDRQLGHISAVFIGCGAVATTTAPLWIRRIDWRLFSCIAAAVGTAILAAGTQVTTLASILVLFGAIGFAKSALYAPSFASLGDTSNPDRAYAISTIAQAGLSAALSVPVSAYIIPRFGVPGLFLTIAAFLFSGLFVCRWMPRGGPASFEAAALGERPSVRGALPPALALIALIFFVSGILGFWYYAERIGAARGVPPDLIGVAISAGALATVAAAGVVTWFGGRLHSLAFVTLGTAIIIAGYVMLGIKGDAIYLASTLMFCFGWGLAQPCYWTVLRKVDASSRIFVAAPAASGAAGVGMGFMAGPVIERGGYIGLMAASAGLLALGLVILTLANYLSKSLRASEQAVALGVARGEAYPSTLNG